MDFLADVADLVVRDPGLTPTGAMRRLRATWPGRETDDTLLRRWQGKWKTHGVELRAAAQARRDAQRRAVEDRALTRLVPGLPASVVAQLSEQLMPLHERLAKQGILSDMMKASPAREAAMAAAAAGFDMTHARATIARLNVAEIKAAFAFADSPAGKAAIATLAALRPRTI